MKTKVTASQTKKINSMKSLSAPCFSLVLLLGLGTFVNAQTYKWQNLWELAYELSQNKKYDQAAIVAEKAVDAAQIEFGAVSEKVAVSLCLLGLCYSGQGKYEVEEEIYKIALPIYEKVYGPNSTETTGMRGCIKEVHRQNQEIKNILLDDKPPKYGDLGWGWRRDPNGRWVANSAGDYRNTVIQENNPARDRRNAAGGSQDTPSRNAKQNYAPINSDGNYSDPYRDQDAEQSARENARKARQAEQERQDKEGMAKYKEFHSEKDTKDQYPKNKDMNAPWNNSRYKDSPVAPHNGIDKTNPMKPWNSVAGSVDNLTPSEREAYGLQPINVNRR